MLFLLGLIKLKYKKLMMRTFSIALKNTMFLHSERFND